MGRGVMVLNGAIAGGGDDLTVPDDAGANRRLAARGGCAGLGKGAIPRIEGRVENWTGSVLRRRQAIGLSQNIF